MKNRFENIYRKYENVVIITLFFVVSSIIILVCSKNSFLYSFNDWVDGNAFFTMGKGMVNGLIPYRDLFEQKGPLLYLIYGIGYLISNDSFIGIYYLEVISLTACLYYIYRISKFFINDLYSACISMISGAIICSSTAFVQGGSAEEFCLPLITYSVYSFLRHIYQNDDSKKLLFINGFIAGCVSLIKFNLLGFWFAWMAIYFFELLFRKEYILSLKSCCCFLLGMFTPIIISIMYFGFNGALKEYYDVYIIFNITAYSTAISIFDRVKNMIYACKDQMSVNTTILYITMLSFITIFIKPLIKNYWISIFVVGTFLLMMVGVYIGGLPFIYYYLCFEVYIIFGLILIVKAATNIKMINILPMFKLFLVVVTLFLIYYNLSKSNNITYMQYSKDYYAQYTFDQIISKSSDKSLLNFDNLDGGFYTASDVLPTTKYFMRQNVSYDRYPEILDGQNDIITNREVKFVIIREYFGNIGYRKTLSNLNDNYKLIKEHKQIYEGMDYTYYLYERR